MTPGTLTAAIIALASAVLDALALFGVGHLDSAQKTAVMTVLTSALALAALLIPYMQHSVHVAQLNSADPAVRQRALR